MPSKVAKKPTVVAVPAALVALPDLITLLEAGVHFGHDRSKRHPKMEPYIYMQRSRVAIIDLEKTQVALERAIAFLHELAKNPASEILFVGTKRQARETVRRHAELASMPYVTRRWLGGTLTNFSTILKSIEKLNELKTQVATDAFAKKTKKERAVMRKEIEHLEAVLEGLKAVKKLPHAVFVVGAHDEKLAVREARRMHIPVVGIADTNTDPTALDYPIPANDDAVRAIELIVAAITDAIVKGRAAAPAPAPAPAPVTEPSEPNKLKPNKLKPNKLTS